MIRRTFDTQDIPGVLHLRATFGSGSSAGPGKRLQVAVASSLHRTSYAAYGQGKHAEKDRESEEIFDRR